MQALCSPEWDAPCRKCGGAGLLRTRLPWVEATCGECNGRGVRDDWVVCPWNAAHPSERDCPLDCDGGVVPYEAACAWLREGATIHVAGGGG